MITSSKRDRLHVSSICRAGAIQQENSVTDAEQQTQKRRIQFMHTPCDLLKA